MKRALKIVAVLVALLVVVAVALPFVIDANQFRPELETRLSAALARPVKLGDLQLSVFKGSVGASQISIEPLLRAKSLEVGVEMAPLILSRKLNVTEVVLDQPEVDLRESATQPAAGQQPKASPGEKTPPGGESSLDVTVKLIRITNGRVTFNNGGKSETLDKVNFELRDFVAGGASPFSLDAALAGGGSFKLNGKAGPLNAADMMATPFEATLTMARLDLAAVGLGGQASIDGSASSNGNAVTVTGKVKAENLKLTKDGTPAKPTVEVDLGALHDLKKESGTIGKGVIRIGSANASLTGTYALGGAAPIVRMKLAGAKMPVDDLAAMLPALHIALPSGASLKGGTMTIDVASEGPLDRLTSDGTVSVDGTSLNNFDLGTKLKVLETLTGIQPGQNTQIQTLSARVHSTPEGSAIDQINFVVPSVGTMTGSGTVSPAQALNFNLMVTAPTRIPLTVTGTASNPVFRPDVKGLASEELKQLTGGKKGAAGVATGILNLFNKGKQ